MWYLVIGSQSDRHFIKKKDALNVYLTNENMDKLEIKQTSELRSNGFKIVGEALESEIRNLEKLFEKVV